MDKTVPQAAGFVLDYLGGIEAPKGYGTIYGNNQNKLSKALTSMTLGEVIAAGPTWTKKYKSSACGRYQFMNATLKNLKTELGLRDSQVFNADLQDRLGFHLLRGRGYDKWASGAISNSEFALGLAKEWASIPVLSNMRGASRNIVRGQSYYAGDALNKSLVKPESVEQMLIAASKLPKAIPVLPTPVFLETPAAPVIPTEVPLKVGEAPVPGMEQAGQGNALLGAFSAAAGKLRAMNPEQAGSLFRSGLQILGTYLTTHGIIANEDWETMSGPLLIVAVTVWGIWARSDSNLLASAAAVPAVKAVVVEDPTVTAVVGDHRVTTEDKARESGLL